jgi:DNA polymerase-3 subunit epsilon
VLVLVWPGGAMSTETVMGWELDPLPGDATNVREVLRRHDATLWFERDRPRQQAMLKLSLPRLPLREPGAAGPAPAEEGSRLQAERLPGARPEFYDFELFARSEASGPLAERPLASLVFTVFDTETTGLDPRGGDEIIQIGAVRVLGGRVLQGEAFDQLVDPRRSIPAAGMAIHGIRPEQVAGQPDIRAVLPRFAAFCDDTVLVGHNAAFDLRFLQLKEAATGVKFEQPVLDTLLLSAVLHPQQSSHRLEAIAERLGVAVSARHDALGDARVTAEVFVRLLPLLAARGIVTLGQAQEAARETWYARLAY